MPTVADRRGAAFTPGDAALLRLAVRPAAALGTHVDLAPDTDGYADRVAAYLRALDADTPRPATLPALEDAAFTAARALLRVPGSADDGVTTARFGASTELWLGAGHEPVVQPDPRLFAGLITPWETRPDVLPRLRLVANNLCYPRGERLVLPAPTTADGRPAHELSVAYTLAVRTAIAAAHTPVRYPDLIALLRDRFPSAPAEKLETFVADQVRHGILLTDLRPLPADPDPVAHVRATLGPDIPAPPGRVDLRLDATARICVDVRADVAAAADLLWRIAPQRDPAHLAEYHAAFVNRYGQGRLVPLLDLLDHTAGDRKSVV